MSQLSCPNYSAPAVLSCHTCPFFLVPTVLSELSCPCRHVVAILFSLSTQVDLSELSCLGCPFMAGLPMLSSVGCPVLAGLSCHVLAVLRLFPAMAVLLWLFCPNCLLQLSCPAVLCLLPVPALLSSSSPVSVRSRLSCPDCSVMAVLSRISSHFSCFNCPVLSCSGRPVILSWQWLSCHYYCPYCPLQLSCPGYPDQLSCPGRPVLKASCHQRYNIIKYHAARSAFTKKLDEKMSFFIHGDKTVNYK